MHVLKLVNKRKRSPACLCSMRVPGSVVICVSGRWRHFQGGVARPVAHAPVPWLHPPVKTVPQSEPRRNVKHKVENCIASSNLTETQYKSSVANKLVDMAMENMYCKIIAFALFHLYFTILNFYLQNFFFSQYFISFAILYFYLQKVHYFFSILWFHFRLQYFNSLANICGIVLTPYLLLYIFIRGKQPDPAFCLKVFSWISIPRTHKQREESMFPSKVTKYIA